MKRILSVLLISALLLSCFALASCGKEETKGMKFVKVSEIDSVDDEETKELLENLTLSPERDYVCILTEDAKGDIEIPRMHQGKFVTMVTAFPGACDDITSITFGDAVEYAEHICSFDSDDPTLKSVSFSSDYQPALSDCFNHCSSLEKTELPESSSYFSELKLLDSFNGCAGLKDVRLEQYTEIKNAFNDCPSLEKAVIGNPNPCTVTDSFNRCSGIGSLGLYANFDRIDSSFNDCTAIESIDLSHPIQELTDSFRNCPVDVGALVSKAEQEAQKELEDLISEQNSVVTHRYEIRSLIKEAWEKLVSDGTIPSCEEDDDGRRKIQFDDADNEIDKPVFSDAAAGKRLTSDPDVKLEKVALVTFDTAGELTNANDDVLSAVDSDGSSLSLSDKDREKIDSRLTDDFTECRYIITYEGFISHIATNAYQKLINGTPTGQFANRYDVTTLVYIIDTGTGEIIHIRAVGTDIPAKDGSDGTTGEVLTTAANEYICSLLK